MSGIGRKLRFGMIGGGQGAFIGGVHRIAAQMDGKAELVAGAFSSDAVRSRASGAELNLDPGRVYGSYEEMVEREAQRPKDKRLDFVSIVTPNHQHFGPAKLLLEKGFNVMCEKPMTLTVAEAEALRDIVAHSGKVFALSHNYTGNAMVKEARKWVRSGRLGSVRKVIVEYSQGWLADALEASGQKQADWRTDPKRSGAAGCIGDIGTHAENLSRYITGLEIHSLCAELTTFVFRRRLDDDGSILVRYVGGARGILYCSQVAVGEENNLNVRVYGDKGSLEWHQEEPNELTIKFPDRAPQVLRRGNEYLDDVAKAVVRLPTGHPEGFLEAFANIYGEFFRAVSAETRGEFLPQDLDLPTVEDGLAGMRLIETAVESSRRGAKWCLVTA